MKKYLFLLLAIVTNYCVTSAQNLEVINDFGVDCIVHQVQDNETFYSIAKKYYVRPSTLAICNNMDQVVTIRNKKVLYIPLTETNYYKIRNTDNGNTVFRELIHIVKSGQDTKQITQEYFITQDQLINWNAGKNIKELKLGEKLVIGFLKYDLNNEYDAPAYIAEEKYNFGTEREKAEAEVDYGIVNTKKVKKKKIYTAPTKLKAPKPAAEEPTVVINQISEKEKDFLKKNKKEKKQKKKLFTSSYAKQKAEREEAIQKRIEARRKIIAKEERKQAAIVRKENILEQKIKEKEKQVLAEQAADIENKTTTTKVKNVAPINIVKVENEKEDPFISTKLQRLTLLKNSTGKATFYYSGTAGAKFYVFTNLAKKGGIIKIKNTQSGRFILAEVVDELPSDDHSKGVLVKISDNAKMILGAGSNFFTAKVYY